MPSVSIEIGSRATSAVAVNRQGAGTAEHGAVAGEHRPASVGHDGRNDRRPDVAPYDALLLVSFGGPEKPEDVVPFLENVTRGRGIPRERLEEVGAALLPLRRAVADQRPQPRPARRARAPTWPRTGSTCRSTGATATGTPTSPTRSREMKADGVTRAACFVDQRLLVVLLVPAVPREPRRRRRAGRGRAPCSTSCGSTSTTPASWSRSSTPSSRGRATGRADARLRASSPTRSRTSMNDGSGPQRRRLPRPAPRRRGVRRRAGRRGDRPSARPRPGLLLALRAAAGAVARARRQRPPREARRRRASPAVVLVPIGFVSDHMEVVYDLDTEALATAERLGPGRRPACRTAGHRPAVRRDGARPAARAGRGRARARRSSGRPSAAGRPAGTAVPRAAAPTRARRAAPAAAAGRAARGRHRDATA